MTFRKTTHLVLRHDRVLGRQDSIIHSNVTQIDLHDFCRLTQTYGLAGFHCVTEMEAQHRISHDILNFWREGFGKEYNPDRVTALGSLCLHRDFDSLLNRLREQSGQEPLLLGTCARTLEKTLELEALSTIMDGSDRPLVIQFGTSWGLSPEQLGRCDWVLPPIKGYDGYNHLSVRCAAAIIVDRLFS